MQYNKIVNSLVEAKTKEFPNRSFHLIQLLGSGSERGAYLANSSNWGNNPQQVVIKIKKNMKDHEKTFISQLIDYQNKYENGNNSQYLPTYLIRIYESFEWQLHHCIIMEVGQESLYDFIVKSKNVSIEQKKKICLQITQPILFLHQQKLIHRDIKPENYIKVGDNFKLIDFGLIISSISDTKTQQIGSAIIQAPEILENSKSYTEKVDVWSLACVFYELLSTQSLFDGQTQYQVTINIKNHKNNPNIVYNQINSLQTSKEIKDIIFKMLSYQEQSRPSIQEVFNDLQKYQASQIIFNQDQQAITQCNNVFVNLIKEGQKQIIDIITNQNILYEDKIIKLNNEFQTQNQINQNKIDQQKTEITELIKQLENLNNQKNKLEQDQKTLKLKLEQVQQQSKEEKVKFDLENNQLTNEIQNLFIKNQKNETLIQDLQDKLKEANNPLYQARNLVEYFQNQNEVQKNKIYEQQFVLQQFNQYKSIIIQDLQKLLLNQQTQNVQIINNQLCNLQQNQDQQNIIQEIKYSSQQQNIQLLENQESCVEYKNFFENLRTELQNQVNDILLNQQKRNQDQLNQISEQHIQEINKLNKEITDLQNQLENINEVYKKEKEQSIEKNNIMENSNNELTKQQQDLQKKYDEQNVLIEQEKSKFQALQQSSQKEKDSLKSELEQFKKKSQEEINRHSKQVDELNKKVKQFEEKDKKQMIDIKNLKQEYTNQNQTLQQKEVEIQKLKQKELELKNNLDQAKQPVNQAKALIELFQNQQNLTDFVLQNQQLFVELNNTMNSS